jgi:hypothetical protein
MYADAPAPAPRSRERGSVLATAGVHRRWRERALLCAVPPLPSHPHSRCCCPLLCCGRRRRKHSRPRGKVRRAGKRARSDPAHDAYVVGCVLEDLMRSVEEVDQLLPHRACELSSPPMHSGGRTRASVSHCWSWPRGPRRSSLTRPAPDQQCACVRCTREEVVAGHAPARAMSADCEPRKEY